MTAGGEVDGEAMGEVTDGDAAEDGGDATSAHAALDSGKNAPVGFVHELLPETIPSLLLSRSGVEDVRGLGLAEGVFAMTERGGRMVKILSSAG